MPAVSGFFSGVCESGVCESGVCESGGALSLIAGKLYPCLLAGS